MMEAKGNLAVSVGERSRKFFRDVIGELKKVQWPKPRQTLSYTGFVILSVVFVGLLTVGFDAIFNLGMHFLIQ